jgi:hypothetical protein
MKSYTKRESEVVRENEKKEEKKEDISKLSLL